jgi:surfactin synthase thioesterase subunit
MDGGAQARRLRSFVLGGLVGASAAFSVARRRRRRRRQPTGLAAFERAPCYQETLEERERRV